MRSIVILAVSICTLVAIDPPVVDMSKLPEALQTEVNRTIAAQMAELDKAQQAIERHRSRLISRLEREVRNFERRNDTEAVAAINAMIEAQKAAPSVAQAGREAVMKSLPADPNAPEDIFDTRTVEQRRRDHILAQQWQRARLSGNVEFQMNLDQDIIKKIDRNEFIEIRVHRDIIMVFDMSVIHQNGPIINGIELFKKIAPNTFSNGVIPERLYFGRFTINGKEVDYLHPEIRKLPLGWSVSCSVDFNLWDLTQEQK